MVVWLHSFVEGAFGYPPHFVSELPRVLLCSFEVVPGPTGAAFRFVEIIKAISQHFQVVALTLKPADLSHIENFQGARLLRVPVGTGDLTTRLQTFSRAVDRQLESEEYALVQFTDPFGGQILCDQRAHRGYRVIYDAAHFVAPELSAAGSDVPDFKRFAARVRRQELSCLMASDAVLTASPLTRNYLETLGVFPNSIHLLRTPASLGFIPRPLPTTEVGLRLIYVGSLEPWQGVDMLLEGLAQARARVPVELVVVGPEHPINTGALKARALELQLPANAFRLESVPRREQIYPLLAEADLAMLPLTSGERNEVRGAALSKISDYLSAGRGVIASDTPASRAVLNDEVASFFPADQPAALAELLCELAKDPKRRIRMGANARHLAETELGLRKFRTTVRSLYSGLLGINISSALLDTDSGEDVEVTGGFAATENRGTRIPDEEGDVTQISEAAEDETSLGAGRTDPGAPDPDATHISAAEIPASARITAESNVPPDPLDPWQALVLHCYCPPSTTGF